MSRGKDISSTVITAVQCRMARVSLGWSLDEFATACGVGRQAILRFEQGKTKFHARNALKVRQALEKAGVRFIDEGKFAGGVAPPKK